MTEHKNKKELQEKKKSFKKNQTNYLMGGYTEYYWVWNILDNNTAKDSTV